MWAQSTIDLQIWIWASPKSELDVELVMVQPILQHDLTPTLSNLWYYAVLAKYDDHDDDGGVDDWDGDIDDDLDNDDVDDDLNDDYVDDDVVDDDDTDVIDDGKGVIKLMVNKLCLQLKHNGNWWCFKHNMDVKCVSVTVQTW